MYSIYETQEHAVSVLLWVLSASLLTLSALSQEGTNTIHVSDLPSGIYLLHLSGETFKLIKE